MKDGYLEITIKLTIIKPYMNTQLILIIISGIAIVLLSVGIFLVANVKKQFRLFTAGANGASLESTMQKLLANQQSLEQHHGELAQFVTSIHHRVTESHRGFAMIKYNAFDRVGGNQSFSCAILDEKGTGMVLSSLYSRERSNVFAKPIINFSCEHELTNEERQVLATASGKVK